MAIKNEGLYTISTKNGKFLEVGELNHDNGAQIRIWVSSGGDAQSWKLEKDGDDFYRIINLFSGKALDIVMQGCEDGTQVHQWETTNSDSQLWSFSSIGRGYYKIISKSCGKCLDRVAMGDNEGTLAQIWEDVGGETQRWRIAEIAGVPDTAKEAKASASRKPARKAKGKSKPTAGKKKTPVNA